MDDHDLARRAIDEVGRRVRHRPPDGLNHPIALDRRLGESLASAQERAALSVEGRLARAAAGPLDSVLDQQRSVNAALIDVLHQLDHRTRSQEHRITELEDELARTRDLMRTQGAGPR